MSKHSKEAVRAAIADANEGDDAALDAILRDDGGGLIFSSIDATFGQAVERAAKGWKQGGDLAAILRSTHPLNAGEREMLARLVEGSLRRKPGKRPSISYSDQRWWAAKYLLEGENEAVMADIVRKTGMERATVFDWVRDLRKGLQGVPDREAILRPILDPEGEQSRIVARQRAAEYEAEKQRKSE